MPDEREVFAKIDALADELAREPDSDHTAQLAWIIDALIQLGHLGEGHRKTLRKLRARASLPLLFGSPDQNAPDPDIDCAARLHLCRARCCTFTVALTPDEVRAGRLEWQLDAPYRLPKSPSGYCTHLTSSGGCAKYEDRPGTCHKYSCRDDKRVWIDFDARIPAPLPFDILPILGGEPARDDD